MFSGRRAWFSQSVIQELCNLWVAEGGEITNLDAADYLFSSDASHLDTKRIHQSLDYLEDRIAVFHSSYLSASASSEMKNTVPLGHFLLPPACLHQEIREKIGNFIWEQITDPQDLQSSPPVKELCNREEDEQEDKRELDRSKDNQTPGMLKNRKQSYIPLRDYPANNMVIGYPSAKEMKKFSGKICDFIPGCSGYLAYWIRKETNVFSELKTKLKRKL